MIIIVGLGPGTFDELPMAVYRLFQDSSSKKFIRTHQHPVVAQLEAQSISFQTFDYLYNQASEFSEVYEKISEIILAEESPILYGVPGHPMVAEESVRRIIAKAKARNLRYKIIPAPSFLDYVFSSLEIDPVEGLGIIDALQIETQQPLIDRGNVITQVYDRIIASNVKLKLMDFYPDEFEVTVMKGLGIHGQEQIKKVPLFELDRVEGIDHLTSVYVPPRQGGKGLYNAPFDELVDVMAKLRSENGCPWDREQTHQSLRKYLLEETYEVLEAIDEEDMPKIQEELGDLLLQIVFHSQIARENEYFDINDVIMDIKEKLIRRHPHVFSEELVQTSGQVVETWERVKRFEKLSKGSTTSPMAGITKTLPALIKSEKIQKKAAHVGFDWPNYNGALEKLFEEICEFKQALKDGGDKKELEEELGDILFATVNLGRFFKIDPEEALEKTAQKFIKRFNFMESEITKRGHKLESLALEELDYFWDLAKIQEKGTN